MQKLPKYRFFLKPSQWKRYWKLLSRRSAILKKYKPFSPRKPEHSPFSELVGLYTEAKQEEPEILYCLFAKICRSLSFDLTAGNLCIGLLSGLFASECLSPAISSIAKEITIVPALGKLLYVVFLIFFSLLISGVLLFFAGMLTYFFVPKSTLETEAEIIYRLLGLDQYFSWESRKSAAIRNSPLHRRRFFLKTRTFTRRTYPSGHGRRR